MWKSSPVRQCTYSLRGWLDPSTGQASVHRASETFLPSLSLFLGPHIPGLVSLSPGVSFLPARAFGQYPKMGLRPPPLPLSSSANCFSCKGGLGGGQWFNGLSGLMVGGLWAIYRIPQGRLRTRQLPLELPCPHRSEKGCTHDTGVRRGTSYSVFPCASGCHT